MTRSFFDTHLRVRQFRLPGRGLFLPVCIWLFFVLVSWGSLAKADSLNSLGLVRSEDGLYLDFNVGFELSPSVEAALQKGVALNFVAEAQVFRERWYWRDQRVSRVTKAWRLSYQPLTRQYRVGFGGAQLVFDNVADALALVQRVSQWKVVEAADLSSSGQYYLQLTYQLDTSALPRPVQVGVGGQADWALLIQKTQRVPTLAVPAPD